MDILARPGKTIYRVSTILSFVGGLATSSLASIIASGLSPTVGPRRHHWLVVGAVLANLATVGLLIGAIASTFKSRIITTLTLVSAIFTPVGIIALTLFVWIRHALQPSEIALVYLAVPSSILLLAVDIATAVMSGMKLLQLNSIEVTP